MNVAWKEKGMRTSTINCLVVPFFFFVWWCRFQPNRELFRELWKDITFAAGTPLRYHHLADFRYNQAVPAWPGLKLLCTLRELRGIVGSIGGSLGCRPSTCPYCATWANDLARLGRLQCKITCKVGIICHLPWEGYGVTDDIHKPSRSSPGTQLFAQGLVDVTTHLPFFSFSQFMT